MAQRDHGGNLDDAIARHGGNRGEWIDLSTGINPQPYTFEDPEPADWAALPDSGAFGALNAAARRFWDVPDGAAVLAAPGASALIAQIPRLAPYGRVEIPGPTYNEHAASFAQGGWALSEGPAEAQVLVHPNNPDGRLWSANDLSAPLRVVDESFCDVVPERSLVPHAAAPGTVILKSFGKFWGLAGLRLGFAIGSPDLIERLAAMLGPWPVSGPALRIGAAALSDPSWAERTRDRLARDAARLDALMAEKGATCLGGTTLFRLYRVPSAAEMQTRLARAHIWTRTFPYSGDWIRLGLPPADGWDRIAAA
ncbi:MAG: threonine-phosphate decarboxylase [Pseudomonadota bacterium]